MSSQRPDWLIALGEDEVRDLLNEAWEAIAFTRQPDDEKAVSENRLLKRIEEWLRV